LFIVGLNIFMTSFILLLIKYVFRVKLRMSEEMLLIGDDAVHGEDAYTFTDLPEAPETIDHGRVPDLESGTPPIGKNGENGPEVITKHD
jgi:ammonium transporter, Amt family